MDFSKMIVPGTSGVMTLSDVFNHTKRRFSNILRVDLVIATQKRKQGVEVTINLRGKSCVRKDVKSECILWLNSNNSYMVTIMKQLIVLPKILT